MLPTFPSDLWTTVKIKNSYIYMYIYIFGCVYACCVCAYKYINSYLVLNVYMLLCVSYVAVCVCMALRVIIFFDASTHVYDVYMPFVCFRIGDVSRSRRDLVEAKMHTCAEVWNTRVIHACDLLRI